GSRESATSSSVAFAHDKVQYSEHSRKVTHHATREQFRQYAQIHKRWRADFETMRDAAAFAVDVKTELTLRIFSREIDFSRWRIETFRHDNKMVNQFLHFCHHVRFRRRYIFPIGHVDRTDRQPFNHLPQNFYALPHLLDPHQVAIVAIARASDYHFEIVLFVIEIRMFAPQIVFNTAAAQNW